MFPERDTLAMPYTPTLRTLIESEAGVTIHADGTVTRRNGAPVDSREREYNMPCLLPMSNWERVYRPVDVV